MSDDPKFYNLPNSEFLAAVDVDNVARAALALAMELAVTNDRLIAMEDFLAGHGKSEMVKTLADHHPSESAQQKMAQERDRIVKILVDALTQ